MQKKILTKIRGCSEPRRRVLDLLSVPNCPTAGRRRYELAEKKLNFHRNLNLPHNFTLFLTTFKGIFQYDLIPTSALSAKYTIFYSQSVGLVSLGGTRRDDISMQFTSRDIRPCWIYTWVASVFLTSILILE